MSTMWKQLFTEPPPDAMQNLLTPRRKFVYAMIAFAPGTLLALYLSSVKRRMNKENEQLRLRHVQDELAGEVAREQKDVVLTQMIEELRERIQQLEREARGDTIAHKANPSPATNDPLTKQEMTRENARDSAPTVTDEPSDPPSRTDLPRFLADYEETVRPWLNRFDLLKFELEKLQERLTPSTSTTDSADKPVAVTTRLSAALPERSGIDASGIRERVAERERAMLAQDVRSHKQQAAQTNSKSP